MFVLSMKTTRARIATVAVVVGLLLVIMVLSRGAAVNTHASVTTADDAARRDYLASLGYTLAETDADVQEVVFPADFDDTLAEYNTLQQEAGFDLDAYRGKRVKCYTYAVTNIPDTAAVAHLYVYQNTVIGGDIASTATDGFCHALVPYQGKDQSGNGTVG